MKDFFNKAKSSINESVMSIINEFDGGVKLVKNVINDLPIFISLERVAITPKQYDEKHYFVIPFYLSDSKFALHTMRSLPEGVHEVNDLPKRRVFHLPNEHYEATLRQFMLEAARNTAYEAQSENISSIAKLADDIDALDSKLTYGMLVVGGLAAIFNPVIGGSIAAKALLPSISGLFAKYGLRPIGEKASHAQIERRAKEAEQQVLKQFSESATLKVVNPILNELEFSLRTNETQHDPLNDPNLASADIKVLENSDWRKLTERAVYDVYKEVLDDNKLYTKANLGPETIRWLHVLLAVEIQQATGK